MIINWTDTKVITKGFGVVWSNPYLVGAVVTATYPHIYAVSELGHKQNTEIGAKYAGFLSHRYNADVGDKFNEETSHKYIEEKIT